MEKILLAILFLLPVLAFAGGGSDVQSIVEKIWMDENEFIDVYDLESLDEDINRKVPGNEEAYNMHTEPFQRKGME